jgi:hypothetical protein
MLKPAPAVSMAVMVIMSPVAGLVMFQHEPQLGEFQTTSKAPPMKGNEGMSPNVGNVATRPLAPFEHATPLTEPSMLSNVVSYVTRRGEGVGTIGPGMGGVGDLAGEDGDETGGSGGRDGDELGGSGTGGDELGCGGRDGDELGGIERDGDELGCSERDGDELGGIERDGDELECSGRDGDPGGTLEDEMTEGL